MPTASEAHRTAVDWHKALNLTIDKKSAGLRGVKKQKFLELVAKQFAELKKEVFEAIEEAASRGIFSVKFSHTFTYVPESMPEFQERQEARMLASRKLARELSSAQYGFKVKLRTASNSNDPSVASVSTYTRYTWKVSY
jgi:hypothetical protein